MTSRPTGPRRHMRRASPLLGVARRPKEARQRREVALAPAAFEYLGEHRLHGRGVLSGAVYVEMAVAMGRAREHGGLRLDDVEFERALLLEEGRPHVLYAVADTAAGPGAPFCVYSRANDIGRAAPHVSLKIRAWRDGASPRIDLDALRGRCPEAMDAARFYEGLRAGGNDYGRAFQGIGALWRGDGEAIAEIAVPASLGNDVGDYNVHPVVLDSAVQLVLAVKGTDEPLGFVLGGIEHVRFNRSPGARCWAHARLRRAGPDAKAIAADVDIVDATGERLVEISGVRLSALRGVSPSVGPGEPAPLTVAVSSTFTAEPIQESLSFWMRELDIPARIAFAPYGQLFQQVLDADSVFSKNRRGLNVALLRLEDWTRHPGRAGVRSDGGTSTSRDRLARYRLPNGIDMVHLNRYETEYLYQEIFRDESYLKHGVALRDGDCVVDIGANIGLFTLWVLEKCRDPRIFAFEPLPAAFAALRANVAAYGDAVTVFNEGVSDCGGVLPLTVYPKATLFSGYYASRAEDRRAMAAVIRNLLREEEPGHAGRRLADRMRGRLRSETVMSPVRTIASLVDEHGLDRIDLLKIDAEKSELAILAGIREVDWKIIRQIVLEVHDPEGWVGPLIQQMLEHRGFVVRSGQEPALRNSGLSALYAVRPDASERRGEPSEPGEAADLERAASEFSRAMAIACERSATPITVCICPPSPKVRHDPVLGARVEAAEARLRTELARLPSVQVLGASEILGAYSVSDFADPHADEMGHVPYTPPLYAAVGTVVARRLHALWRAPYKVIVLDADDTLWKGRCGEDAPETIEIDAGRRGLQERMRRQHDAGLLLALCSRNNEDDVLRTFERHAGMPLTLDHFIARRLNWKTKSDNLADLAAELGLGLDSFIFVDDDPRECAEVRARCPQVLTLDLPADPDRIPHYLDHVWAFDRVSGTGEAARRPVFYRDNARRETVRQGSLTLAEFLAGLEIRVRIAWAAPADLPRVAELTQRTSQFNVTSIRRSEAEIRPLVDGGQLECLVVDVSDRFGHYGIVGAILFRTDRDALSVDTFLLSCRALGRGVEHRMLARLGELAVERGHPHVVVPFVATNRNDPALAFLLEVGVGTMTVVPRHSGGSGRVFRFLAQSAASVTHRPSTEPMSAVGVNERGPDEGARAAAARPKPSILERIPSELSEAGRILDAIRERGQPQPAPAEDAAAPSGDDMERTITEVWREVLGIATVGVNDNFSELGGTSLAAVLVTTELERRLNRDLSPVSVFEKTTVASMTKLLKQQGPDAPGDDMAASRRRGAQRRARALAGTR